MICNNCSTENEAGRKFCKECGTSLAMACPNCGAANTPDSKFCGNCGNSLVAGDGQSAAPAVHAPVAERRLVSVLFADLVGFTSLSEERDPEETRELLTRYFAISRDVISRHGGTVEKFIGDAVMAVWGAPIARENDAELAVRAALALVDGVRALGPEIKARAAVLTGEAAVTLGAAGEGMVAGDLVNTASRLQSVAPEGSVLVGESTERASNQAIIFEPAGEQLLKGKQTPIPAFRALRVVAEMGGRNRADVLEAPFVGRDDDFRLLVDMFHATARDRRPRLVSVMGPAGIGKSRLAWEFSKYIDGLVDDTYWHIGRSPSYGEGITFWALGEMIRRRAGLLEGDDEPTTRQKIGEMAREWAREDAELRWLEISLLALLGLGEAPPGGRDELFAAWRTLFERIAEHGPTVLVFEDVQWADGGLVDFIEYLHDATKSLPIFVITLARPDLLERRPDWGAGRRNFVSLVLDPLGDEPMRELLEGLVPGLPEKLVTTIVARADGVPLYAVETVRMLLAEGNVVLEGGSYRPVGDLTTFAIPETLMALVAARLDSLSGTERSAVQAAAVLGQSFSLVALAAVSAIEQHELSAVLAALLRRELLTLDSDPRSPERGQYSFVQAIVREVAYNQLARSDRKGRHLAAARWFESLGDEELAGALAEHYLAAQRNAGAGPEADALAGQSRVALRAAADRAARLGSHPQAEAYVLKALDLTDDPAERAALYERAGEEATDASPDRAFEHYGRALALFKELDDVRGIARSATGISVVLNMSYRPADAVATLEEAVALTRSIENEPEAIRLLAELARAYANTRHPGALELVDKVLAKAESLDLVEVTIEALLNRALGVLAMGRFYEAMAITRGVIPIAENHNLYTSQWRAINNLAVALMNEDIRETVALFRLGLERASRIGSPGQSAFFRGVVIIPLLYLGEWAEAGQLIDELDEADQASGTSIEYLEAKMFYFALRGDVAKVAQIEAVVAPIVAQASLAEVSAWHQEIKGQAAALDGHLDLGYELLEKNMLTSDSATPAAESAAWAARVALWNADREGVTKAALRLRAIRSPGRVIRGLRADTAAATLAADGRSEEALTAYRAALAGWRDLGLEMSLGMTLTDMAVALDRSDPQVAAAADEAREIWTRLGSPPMLARLDQPVAWPRTAPGTPPVRPKNEVRAEESASA